VGDVSNNINSEIPLLLMLFDYGNWKRDHGDMIILEIIEMND
jgi:hypothetical protein